MGDCDALIVKGFINAVHPGDKTNRKMSSSELENEERERAEVGRVSESTGLVTAAASREEVCKGFKVCKVC